MIIVLIIRLIKGKLGILQMASANLQRIQSYSLGEMKVAPTAQAGLRKWKVKSLGIFGSYVRGEARKSSDLDLLVEIDDPKMGLLRFIALENYLSDLLGVKVDLVEKPSSPP